MRPNPSPQLECWASTVGARTTKNQLGALYKADMHAVEDATKVHLALNR